MAQDETQPAHADDPLVRLIRTRHSELDENRILVLKLEWWSLYRDGFTRLGTIAADAVGYIDAEGPVGAIKYLARRISLQPTGAPVQRLLAEFGPELHEPMRQFLVEGASRDEVYALLVNFMKLGRREVVALN